MSFLWCCDFAWDSSNILSRTFVALLETYDLRISFVVIASYHSCTLFQSDGQALSGDEARILSKRSFGFWEGC